MYTRKWMYIDSPVDYGLELLQFGFQECEPGYFFGPATRDYMVIHFVVKGEGEFKCDGKTYAIRPGMSFLIKPEQRTFYKASEKTPWHYYWVGMKGRGLPAFMQELEAVHGKEVVFPLNDTEELTGIFAKMLAHTNNTSQMEIHMKADHYLQGCLHMVLAQVLHTANANAVKEKKTDFTAEAIEFIENHYKEDLKISQLCKMIGVDRTLLFRHFKKECGLSPQDYLINCRLKQAVFLMKESNLNLNQISYEVGFNTYSHFSGIFKKKFGKTPNEFQKNYK